MKEKDTITITIKKSDAWVIEHVLFEYYLIDNMEHKSWDIVDDFRAKLLTTPLDVEF